MPTNEAEVQPQRTKLCIRAGKADWIGIAYVDAPTAIDPSKIYEYVSASALEDFRRRAIEAVRALDCNASDMQSAVVHQLQSLPVTSERVDDKCCDAAIHPHPNPYD